MIRSAAVTAALAMVLAACSGQDGGSLDRAIMKFKGDGSHKKVLGKGLLAETSLFRFKDEGLRSSGSCLFYAGDASLDIVFPSSKTIPVINPDETVVACSNDSIIGVSDGASISLHGIQGRDTRNIPLEDATDMIKALCLSGQNAYYYRGHRIYRQHMEQGQATLLVKESFSPPYTKHYQVQLFCAGSLIAATAGSAGEYYINIISAATGRTLVTKIKASSAKTAVLADRVYYISGGSGNWELVSFSYANKHKRTIRRFRTIRAIELVAEGFFLLDGEGLWVQDYGKNIEKIPFSFKLAGKYGGLILLAYEGQVYGVDVTTFMEKLDRLKLQVPEIF
jgi:hypothetical protein